MNDVSDPALEAGPEVVTEDLAEQPEEGQVETQTAEAEAPETDAAEEEKKSEAAKRREREKAHKQRLKDRADEAEQRARRAEAEIAKLQERIASAPPRLSDFDDPDDYNAARLAYEVRKASGEDRRADLEADVKASRAEAEAIAAEEREMLAERYRESVVSARTRYVDFDQVVGRPGLFPGNSFLPDMITASDNPADLAYMIASDKSLHDSLLGLHPIEAARELGRLESRIERERAKTQTSAPPPVTPVRGGASSDRDPSKMTGAEYIAWRNAGGRI